ncbi:MAG TPA: lamin tail domain-containing protein, partial [Candidatus Cloacimonadota bacterium]|nr:lamin tail domain-containing protein [Candidatus Cloacimonadota bacterium]
MNMRVILLGLLFLSMASIVMAQATDLFISEYVEGTSNQKAIEIFNGTGAPVDLSQYSLKKQTNGAGAFGNEL